MMVGNTLEIAHFRLSQGTTKEQFLEGVKASTTFLTAQPGFVSRRVSFLNDGEIFGLVEWESPADAQAAFKLSMEGDYPALRQFIDCLDMASGSMKHGEVLHVTG
jgi:hypothetical protein